MHRGHHTLEAFTFVNYEPFRRWANWSSAGQSAEDRPAEYQALKQELAEKMLKTVDKIVPGLRDNLVYCNLGTPLTNEYYLNATQGNIYGVAHSRRQAGPFAFPYRTEIENLWMCGASTPAGHGVAGASLSGLMVAKGILKCRLSDLLQANGPELAIYPSEDSSLWPDRLQRRIQRGKKL
jgi:phytoene dehydrogenase-like protein